jgi:YVTN family beta-propeller protein
MKQIIPAIALLFYAAACIPTPPPPTAVIPTPTTAPTRAATPSPSPTVALTAPAIQARVSLLELPGIGRSPSAIAILGDKIYVANGSTNNIAVVQNDRAVKFIGVGRNPAALAADPAQNRLYVANAGDKTVSVIANDQVALTQDIGSAARALLFFENRLFAALDSKDGILVLDPATLQTQARISIPNAFTIINLSGDPARRRIYANYYEKTAVIDSTNLRLLTTLAIKGSYYTLLANPSSDNVLIAVYDANSQSQFLAAFDPTSGAERGRAKIGGDPRGATLSADGARAYVANSFSNDVSVIDTRAMNVVATIAVGMQPYALALDEKARRLYVANSDSDNLTAINTETLQVAATIPLATVPTALLADERAGRVYVANASTDSVFVIEGARVTKEIGVGRHPIDLARDEKSNRLFVANRADGTLSIIDESNFSARATPIITRSLSTIAVDAAHSRLFARDAILDLNTLSPIGKLTLRGGTLGSIITADLVRVNPSINRIYATGGNGIPGSNGRIVTYSIDGATLQQRGTWLNYSGNTSFFEIDPANNRVYLAGTHPLAYTNELRVFDSDDNVVFALTLPARTTGMAYNPQTHHLFLAHASSFARASDAPTADNTIQILDTTTFGEVARIHLDSPGIMARLGNTIYVANRNDATITLIQDVSVAAPPSPTPTFTPTRFPTLPPPPPQPTRTITPTPRATMPICGIPIAALVSPRWTPDVAARIGCPVEAERKVQFAAQPFERGVMQWREDEKRIYVFFEDKTWAAYDDTWKASLPEDACPSITVSSGLKPKRGFGKVWCEQVNVRAKIGAATAAEQGLFSGLTQRFARGVMFGDAQSNQILVLYADNLWE